MTAPTSEQLRKVAEVLDAIEKMLGFKVEVEFDQNYADVAISWNWPEVTKE